LTLKWLVYGLADWYQNQSDTRARPYHRLGRWTGWRCTCV
jgi:hypothetical protein